MRSINFIRDLAYRVGIRSIAKLDGFTISVGNLSVGGTGKSPLVQLLSQAFLQDKISTCVLSRGYGRDGSALVFLDSEELPKDISKIGDECAMLKGKFPGVGLVVHPKRAQKAKDLKKFSVYILDDGFQHWQAWRDFDVVLWDATESLDQAELPLGRLREGLHAFSRADAIVLTRVDEVSAAELSHCVARIQQVLSQITIEQTKNCPWRPVRKHNVWPPKVYMTRHKAVSLVDPNSQTENSLQSLQGKYVLPFCGIGRPSSFFRSLERMGAFLVDQMIFPDHYQYKNEDIQNIKTKWLQHNCPILVTTEKDFYRSTELLMQLEMLQLLKIEVDFVQDGRERFLREVKDKFRWVQSSKR